MLRIDDPTNAIKLFLTWPWYAPLLFPNSSSDARDHAANERTYLSYLRLSVYLAIVAVAILINFHLKHQPTALETRISHPLGYLFWALAVACLVVGFANYVQTVAKYARKAALVQSGLKTQLVFGVVSCAIIAACGIFLAVEGQRKAENGTRSASTTQLNSRPNFGSPTQLATPEYLLRLLADVGGSTQVQADSSEMRLNHQQ